MQPFHGILQNEGKTVSNWGLSRTTKPAVYAEPITYADVQAIVRDAGAFPTPVGDDLDVDPYPHVVSVSQGNVDGAKILRRSMRRGWPL